MNKIKNYYLTFILAICVTLITLIVGCNRYEEGDTKAEASFKKMTIQEKTLYDAVEKEWHQKPLIAVREAVGRRDITPREQSIPFFDIANVIKTNNDVTLTIEDKSEWNTDHKNRAIKCRWDRLDEDWYRKILESIVVNNYKPKKLVLIKEESKENSTNDNDALKSISDNLKEVDNDLDSHPEVIKVNIKDIIPEAKYDDLYFEIKRCPEAVQTYKQMINEHILTWQDYELLIRISIKCKAAETLNKLEM